MFSTFLFLTLVHRSHLLLNDRTRIKPRSCLIVWLFFIYSDREGLPNRSFSHLTTQIWVLKVIQIYLWALFLHQYRRCFMTGDILMSSDGTWGRLVWDSWARAYFEVVLLRYYLIWQLLVVWMLRKTTHEIEFRKY